MIQNNSTYFTSLIRNFDVRVALKNAIGTKLCTLSEEIQNISVERTGVEGKFFGFGATFKLSITFRNVISDIQTGYRLAITIKENDGTFPYFLPDFYITERNKDENTGVYTITAYDKLNEADKHTANEIETSNQFTVLGYAKRVASVLGISNVITVGLGTSQIFALQLNINEVNLEGTESIREVLDDIAEFTQTIYYMDRSNVLVFRRLNRDGEADYTISKDDYFSLSTKTNRRLTKIVETNELNDSVYSDLGISGSTQYIRDNAFLALREDKTELVQAALNDIGGLTINQFDVEWRGNLYVEYGDKIALVDKEGNTINTFLLNDSISYDGSLTQKSSWTYGEGETEETESNPDNLGEALKQTFAKVDKANKQIQMIVQSVGDTTTELAELQLNQSKISASVEKIEKRVDENYNGLDTKIDEVKTQIDAKMSSEDVKITITEEIRKGVEKVDTSTGITVDKEGITVDKSGSEMSTNINEDGMKVKQNGEEVLTANNQGVDARNLSATTYLIVGGRSRFENYDYNGSYTACFWIGGD